MPSARRFKKRIFLFQIVERIDCSLDLVTYKVNTEPTFSFQLIELADHMSFTRAATVDTINNDTRDCSKH